MPSHFWNLLPWEWSRVQMGYLKRQTEYWRMAREILTLTYNINVDKAHRKSPEQYLPLFGDKTHNAEPAYLPPIVMLELISESLGIPIKQSNIPTA